MHAFLVPIRDEDGAALPGVTIEDCGAKAGLNGVDNGRLTLRPRAGAARPTLLDRYGDVAADGTYTSPIENPTRRFFTMLGTLVRGRISVGGRRRRGDPLALTIAVRYGERRAASSPHPARDDEVVLLDYLAHQRRLLPALATTYALHFAQNELVALLHDVQSAAAPTPPTSTRQRELESRAAGRQGGRRPGTPPRTIQACREACGGAGYLAENRLPALKADTRRLHHVRGRQHRAAAARRQGAADQLPRRLRRPGHARHGAVRGRAGRSSGRRADVGPRLRQRLADARPRRPRGGQPARPRRGSCACSPTARSTCSTAWPAGCAPPRSRAPTRSRCSTTRRTTSCSPRARTSTGWCPRRSPTAVDECPDPRRARAARPAVHAARCCTGWSRTAPGTSSTAGSRRPAAARSPGLVNAACAQLRPHALDLVDGFGIPDAWLGAPLLRPLPLGPDSGQPSAQVLTQRRAPSLSVSWLRYSSSEVWSCVGTSTSCGCAVLRVVSLSPDDPQPPPPAGCEAAASKATP